MDKAEHGKRLTEAMAASRHSRQDVADYVGRNVRTVTNWTSGSYLPSAQDQQRLRDLFGDYMAEGDPVEVAIRRSGLAEWRQDTVVGFYKRHLAEQAAAETSRAG